MHILVVDDSEDGRDIAEAMLLAAGYRNVSTVGSAADAFALLAMDGQATVETSPVDLRSMESRPARASTVIRVIPTSPSSW
jgi:CheY-like chemotaxis protein